MNWLTHVCPSGTSEQENIDFCLKRSREQGREVIFCWNYYRFYKVFPDGSYEFQDNVYRLADEIGMR